ncbi:hypothetical protein ACQKMD_21445 [Viridibacillus sp. NPDC096237]|uniref:hypothetical protein n=1 Tax=Viridibacillus sp. NPDC096237 TaxID=3390721 RepID=UPI003D0196F4
MNTYIKEEFRRAFFSKATLLSVILSIILMFWGMFESLKWIASGDVSILYAFLQGYNSGTSNFLIIAFPILACIPFATSYKTDSLSGFNRYVYIRKNKINYMIIKLCVNSLVGGFVVFIGPFIAIIYLLINKMIFGSPMIKEQLETISYFKSVGVNSPILMLLIILGILFLCGLIFSTFGLGVSAIMNNKYVAILVPFIYFIISATVLSKFNTYLNIVAFYDVDYGMTFGQRMFYGGILIILSIIVFFIGGSKKFEEKNI